MTSNDTLIAAGEVGAAPAPDAYSADWWQLRTAAELRDIIKRGFAAGQAFEGAVAETERRAREMTRRARDNAAAEFASRRKRNRLLAIAAAGAGAGAMLVSLVWLA